jgi:DNA gyrase subunit A
LVGLLTLPSTASVFLLTQQGYGKRLSLNTVRLGNFGDLGTTVLQFTDKTDSLLLMTPASDTALTAISNQQTVTVIVAEQFQAWGKDGPGDSLLSLSPGEYLVGQLQGDGGA